MHLKRFTWLALGVIGWVLAGGASPQPVPRTVADFRLLNTDGRTVSLADYPNARGFIIVFTCNHCPFAKLYPPRLNELNTRFGPQGVPVIAISPTDTAIYEEDTYANMVRKAQAEGFNFPYLIDETQAVAQNFGADKTPHAFVIWKENGEWVIKYNGAIDNNGAHPNRVSQPYVANAVTALLAGRPVPVAETASIGCRINYRAGN